MRNKPKRIKVAQLMKNLQDKLNLWKQNLIDYCSMIMNQTQQTLIKVILDE